MSADGDDRVAPCAAGVDRGGRHRWEILRELWRCLDCGAEQLPRPPAPHRRPHPRAAGKKTPVPGPAAADA